MRAAFSSEPIGLAESERAKKLSTIDFGIKAVNSGVDDRYAAICGNGRNPQRAVKGVRAKAISGLWLASK